MEKKLSSDKPEYYKVKRIPKVGDTIYIQGAMYMSHGEDDYNGGQATLTKVEEGISGGEPAIFVSVKEVPGHSWNWQYLEEKQKELKKQYGKAVAHPDPDERPEFNCFISPGDTVHSSHRDPKTGNVVETKRIATKYEK